MVRDLRLLEPLPAGIDIGSTTVKVVICEGRAVRFFRYRRHNALAVDTLRSILAEARRELGNRLIDPAFTGSAGMGVAESLAYPFLQEVVASTRLIRSRWPAVRTLIEVGGEDSKIAFFDDQFQPDIRMNGNCAGGTGAFIEQMALLLNVPLGAFDDLAGQSTTLYPIASRCGVFAKTDIQSLIANRVAREDIAASVFHAVALQVISTLARGCDIRPQVLFAGGPLTFFPRLREAFLRVLRLDPTGAVADCDHSELIAAEGAALHHDNLSCPVELDACIAALDRGGRHVYADAGKRLTPLFWGNGEFAAWEERHSRDLVAKTDLSSLTGRPCFVGIDSGSTTTKLAVTDAEGRVAFSWYGSNGGDPVGALEKGMAALQTACGDAATDLRIARSAVTGYGEDLIRAAFAVDDGVVETLAHYRAARSFVPGVSFILDIGGQDMKAIRIRDGAIAEVHINEACSSGCGSFLETFARSLDYAVADFARCACGPNEPFDLGTRCTVFMNSKVKQALREGATVGDIAAGLAYSVIKNSLHKVLKLKDTAVMGDAIVVQGGTFRNPAVLRAFELLIGKEVIRPDISEAMGAYGAALTALANHRKEPAVSTTLRAFAGAAGEGIVRKEIHCAGCENRCRVVRLNFPSGRSYFTGNRCERLQGNAGGVRQPGENLVATRLRLLFDRQLEPAGKPRLTIGIPRVLNMYENFPFWCTLLRVCGFRVVLSAPSGMPQLEKGIATVMSDSICFPGKLVHGHIIELIERGVDRIFYPLVVFERGDDREAHNSFNCPVVTGYPDVIRSAVDPEGRYGVPIDSPVVSFKDTRLLKKQLRRYLGPLGVEVRSVDGAVEQGITAQRQMQQELRRQARAVMERAAQRGTVAVVVAGRPYHADPLINHGLPDLLAGLGVDVIPESAVPIASEETLHDSAVLTQWAYTNRILAAAGAVARTPHLEMLQVTSFGCGLDAISADEVREVLQGAGKTYTMIKVDEIANPGAVRIRLRSMLEAIRERSGAGKPVLHPERTVHPSPGAPEKRTVLVPWFSPLYSPFIPPVFASFGCRVELLLPQDRTSVEVGLRYVNNDMCYPAVIVIGDIIKALQSGRYEPETTTVLLPQTFGQCRASNYLPLARKALRAAGFPGVAVVSLAAERTIALSGVPIDHGRLLKRLALGFVFSDALARMALATAPREIHPGAAMALQRRYIAKMGESAGREDFGALLALLGDAVDAFNTIEVKKGPAPVVGVLGEIFVKHNAFSNNNIVEWLIGQGVEVVIPSLLSFFEQRFVNERFDQEAYLKRSLRDLLTTRLQNWYVRLYLNRVERVMEGFRSYRRDPDLATLAAETSRTTSLANQAGEGWLLPAEMIAMFKEGVGNIICLQPFGCLANQIIGKGVEKRLKSLYQRLNILFIDMDAGASEVNIMNRLHFMVVSAREGLDDGPTPPGPGGTSSGRYARTW
ncbi:MAG: acyl-CoA dehydratase activase-related protein [Syntrophales bacterium]